MFKTSRLKDDLHSTVHRELLLKHLNRDLIDHAVVSSGPSVSDAYVSRFSSSATNRNSVVNVECVNHKALMAQRQEFVHTVYGNYQPHSYLMQSVCGGVGTVLLASAVRCRYFRRKIVV